MIAIRNLSKSYGTIKALDQLELEIGKGVVFGLLGPNGAGKTTLVSILNGLLDFDTGEIEVFGMELKTNISAIRKRSAFIPQALALYDNLSVIENLRFFAGIQKVSGPELRASLDYAISVNRLEAILEQRAKTLSGGQKRRLNIAIGLLNNPELLYFDEPTVGIDPESRNQILETIRACKNDAKTVIYTSHYMPEIEKICDEVAIIDHGRIALQGRLESLLQEEKTDSVVFELLYSSRLQLEKIARQNEDLEVVDAATLLLVRQNAMQVGRLLEILEREHIAIKQVRYGTTNLEALFLRLTAAGAADV